MTQDTLVSEQEKKSVAASEEMMDYFERFRKDTNDAYMLAQKARGRGYDPDDDVSVAIAKTLAERVIGLMSVIVPEFKNVGIEKRIEELETKYGVFDWRISFEIALEVAQQKFCPFETELDAITAGVRLGFTYITSGVVSAPLEGLTSIEIIPRMDREGKYFRLNFAGPIRNAGGTAASVCVLIADYLRKSMGYATYDPTEKEILRCPGELADYHNFITNLQYFPSEQESIFLLQHMPVEIAGDPSEKYEVSNINLKDLPRVSTNKLRSGYCLIHSSCIPLKAPKLWKQLSKWGEEFGMGHWNFLSDFVKLQKRMKAGKDVKEDVKIAPDYTYIKDLVAGRPVLAYPLRPGGFRLRYGRSRSSGYSGQAIHPATMHVLLDYIASGTQLKVERPGKAATYMPCDTIDGPIVKLLNGDVVHLQTEEEALAVKKDIAEILYLGDILINYGDFYDRNHNLVPAGYCPEWWIQEVKQFFKSSGEPWNASNFSRKTGVSESICESIISSPMKTVPPAEMALKIAETTKTALHPAWTPFWMLLNKEDLLKVYDKDVAMLEVLGIPYTKSGISADWKLILDAVLPPKKDVELYEGEFTIALDILNSLGTIKIRDKAGTFIGARMGRPEKAKMRKMTGSPHCLFPIGEEGGRLRSMQEALRRKKVTAEFPLMYCPKCEFETVFRKCEVCDSTTEQRTKEVEFYGTKQEKTSTFRAIPVNRIFNACLKKLNFKIYPDLIKGVRGTSNKCHIPEHLVKGILRARHSIAVNKDGTTRYDSSEVALTHFKPSEAQVSVEKLRSLGYKKDCYGENLENENQILELKPQDLLLPCCDKSPDEPADEVLFRISKFVDEELKLLYGLDPYYRLKTKEDLVGHYIVGLAPHTSAGTVGRIVGFSKTQGFLAHPFFHAAMRRDCFTAETYLPFKHKGKWSMERIGDVVEQLNPTKLVDAHGTLESTSDGYKTLGLVDGKIAEVTVQTFTKHTPMPIVEITTELGKQLRTTENHKHVVIRKGKEQIVRAGTLRKGDVVKLPYNIQIPSRDVKEINLLKALKEKDWLMVRGLKRLIPEFRSVLQDEGLSKHDRENFSARDSVPAKIAIKIMRKHNINPHDVKIAAVRDTVTLPAVIKITDDFLTCVGLYVAEGYAREQRGTKGSYQVYIAASKKEIRTYVQNVFKKLGLKPSERKTDRVTYSSRILYELFTSILSAGSSAYEKRLPALFLQLPPKRMGKLLGGYFEGDGSVSKSDLRLVFDTVSQGLIHDLEFVFGRLGVFVKLRTSTRKPGKPLQEFYKRKNRPVPFFTCTRGIIQSKFVHHVSKYLTFLSREKRERHEYILKNMKFHKLFCEYDNQFFYDTILSIKKQPPEPSYCLTVPQHRVIANNILTKQCDGDESCIILLMDVFLNFSSKFLPETRGSTMDAPLVITYLLNPMEVDDMVFHVDRVWEYPLEMYEAALEYKKPYDVKVELIESVLGKPEQFEGMGFTHDTTDLNGGVTCSAYKILPSMREKMEGQMEIAKRIRACDTSDVARLVIDKHFMRDIKGNLRKFTQQEWRCVKCNTKFRRPPLVGKCTKCTGKIIFTIAQGSVIKYLQPSLDLAEKYNVPFYMKQDLALLARKIDDLFGKDPEKQLGLGEFA